MFGSLIYKVTKFLASLGLCLSLFPSPSLCLCLSLMCMCVRACRHASACLHTEAREADVCLFLPHSFETGSLTAPGARLASKPSGPPVSVPHRAGVTGTESYSQLFTWVLGIWPQVLMLVQQTFLATEPQSDRILRHSPAALKFSILLPLFLKHWDYRYVPPSLTSLPATNGGLRLSAVVLLMCLLKFRRRTWIPNTTTSSNVTFKRQ